MCFLRLSGDIVCVAADANRAGTLGSIGAFISPDSSLKVNDFPAGQSATVEFAVTVI